MARQSCHDWLMFWLQALPVIAPLLTALLLLDYGRRVCRAGRREAESDEASTERREPRDITRPYPKRVIVGPDDERLTTCPVCGMEDPLFLDGGPWQANFFG